MSQLVILVLVAMYLGRQRGMSLVMGKRIAEELKLIPEKIKQILENASKIKKIAKKNYLYNDFLYLGRKYNFAIAYEGALKLKEISYIHAEGYGSGEMKHGPIALIDEKFPCLFICPQDSVYEKNISNLQEVKARKGKIIAVATEGDKNIKKMADEVIYIPKTLEMLTPLLAVVPLQLFAYYCAVFLKRNVDQPRNLAKSVTVE
jgi:glucosamine--fructose-6-phosphate aminotransferase (isomerizing)